jgi:hypothetical protein
MCEWAEDLHAGDDEQSGHIDSDGKLYLPKALGERSQIKAESICANCLSRVRGFMRNQAKAMEKAKKIED